MNELLEQLKYWRAERPDEWKMDEFLRLAEEQNKRIVELESHNLGLTKTLVEIEKDREIRDLEQQAKGLENYANEELSGLAADNIHWMLIRAKDLREQAKQLKDNSQ